ncbi:MAG: hypothetical protein K2L67_04245 [Clostridia bacterium]|nr:hypothetical protein [Clostridia bacterium]
MLCQHCKKNTATYNKIVIVGDKKFESHLCEACYVSMFGELNSKGDILGEMTADAFMRTERCPVCGTTFYDYEQTGLLGCASCYDVFKSRLLPVINRIHGKTEHVGKVGSNNDELGLHHRLKALQGQLEKALREKRFNDADELNRRIYEISKKLYGGEHNG